MLIVNDFNTSKILKNFWGAQKPYIKVVMVFDIFPVCLWLPEKSFTRKSTGFSVQKILLKEFSCSRFFGRKKIFKIFLCLGKDLCLSL